MNVVLYHPRHGTKVAISKQEIEADILRGWSMEPPAPPATVDNALRRPGRPRKDSPHDSRRSD